MMKATGSGSGLELRRDGQPIEVLDHAKIRFGLGGQPYTVRPYTVRRSGFLGPRVELQLEGSTLVPLRRFVIANLYERVMEAPRTVRHRSARVRQSRRTASTIPLAHAMGMTA